MQGLALADGLTALCTYGFEPFFSLHYERIGNDKHVHSRYLYLKEMKRLVGLKFPYCVMHYCLTNLGDTFHIVSILLTTSLGFQKLLAVACPIWSKTQIKERESFIVCGTSFVVSLVVNIPRLFVISFSCGKKGDTCLVSKPHKAIQKYILAYHPIFNAIILVAAVVTMLISTCYIIFTLCRRKRVRGHATVSRAEKKSCILIVCVMIVFSLAELPRIYVSSTLFSTYRSTLDTQSTVLHKTKTELSQRFATCLGYFQNNVSERFCNFDFKKLSQDHKADLKIIRQLKTINKKITKYVQRATTDVYRKQLKGEYFEYLVDVLDDENGLYANATLKYVKQHMLDIVAVAYCYKRKYTLWRKKMKFVYLRIFKCLVNVKYAPGFVLGSSPYSEPMNYLMHIGWGHIDFTLEHLKLLIEVLKLLMIIGCASNFLIYIVMSDKLREALKKTFKCREHQEERVDTIQMQTRG
ncbi:unnamed protein product [Mytilus coruscus]|uniref:G-protein coupled receptors family 1 profile domain-containing protein n=1 Tax=Mytilus coruscus TaxID=42192 RepID=A0A6J8D0K4_MYTCO|nr:unnamed protein product [Mytilus coruscus]